MSVEVGWMMTGVALLILVGFCIPVLIKVWRALRDVSITLETLNARLPGILKNLEEISGNINASTTAINQEVQKYADTAAKVHAAIDHVATGIQWLSPVVVRMPVLRKLTELVALVKGVRVFVDTLAGKK